MGFSDTISKVQKLIAQGIGAILALVGAFFALSSFPPQDTEAGAILAIGVFVLLFGVVIILNPEKVRFGGQSPIGNDDDQRLG